MPQYFEWMTWNNPVSVWWVFLSAVSICNILAWVFTFQFLRRRARGSLSVHVLLWLSAAYVFVCAFRSFLPRADVQRIMLFDSWVSSVLVGRSAATVAELSFVAQWAIVVYDLAVEKKAVVARYLALSLVPIIAVAECFSWYASITTFYGGNAVEESLWAVTYTLIALSLVQLFPKFRGALKYAIGLSVVGSLLYVAYMVTNDVPMYLHRMAADQLAQKPLLGFWEGVHDLFYRRIVTHDIADWRDEIPWMSLYFTVAVWTSIFLCYVPLRARGPE